MCSLVEHCFSSRCGGEDLRLICRALQSNHQSQARWKESVQAPSSAWYQGLRDDGNPCRAFSDWFILQENTSLNKDSHILCSLYFNSAYPLWFLLPFFCYFYVFPPTSWFCRDLCFLVIGNDTTERWALVRATANQTRPREMWEGTELDQLQRKTEAEDDTFCAATVGSVRRKQSLPLQSCQICNDMRYIKKPGVTGDG